MTTNVAILALCVIGCAVQAIYYASIRSRNAAIAMTVGALINVGLLVFVLSLQVR